MVITYHENLCVKVQVGDTILSFNPPAKGKTKFAADVVFVSMDDPAYNGVANAGWGEKQPLIISGPGEYEVGGIFVKGIGVEETVDGKKKINTIYFVLMDDIRICHLGAYNISEVKPEIMEEFGKVDILFVPICGENVLTPAQASKIAAEFEPNITIPLYCDEKGPCAPALKSFLKEEGGEGASAVDKYTIKKKELLEKNGEDVVLKPLAYE